MKAQPHRLTEAGKQPICNSSGHELWGMGGDESQGRREASSAEA
jgi:hypothetical protein